MPWRRLLLFLEQLPPGPESAFRRAVGGEDALWSLEAHLLAGAVDRLEVANWQRSADGEKGTNKPTPTPRPGLSAGGVSGPKAAAIRAKARELRARKRKRGT